MKQLILVPSLLLFIATSPFAQYSKQQLQNIYQEALNNNQNYTDVMIDSDGDIQFFLTDSFLDRYRFYIGVNEDDPKFFRIVMIQTASIDMPENEASVIEILNDISGKFGSAKLYINNSEVYLAAETFIRSPYLAESIIDEMFEDMRAAYAEFDTEIIFHPNLDLTFGR